MNKKILIIDDEADLTKLLSNFLSRDNTVYSAADGEHGLRLFEKHKPDLVLLDVNLPGQSGIDVLRAILESDGNAVVVMLSSSPFLDLARQTIKMGASDYISKPFDFGDLKEKLSKHLNRAPKTSYNRR